MSCGVDSCRRRAKQFGVCGVHKKYKYLCREPAFQTDMEAYRQLFVNLVQESDKLEAQGHNILAIQSCWESNLCGPRKHPFPNHLKVAGELFEQLVPTIEAMQKKYDPQLVSNVAIRIRHSEGPPCACSYCRLGATST